MMRWNWLIWTKDCFFEGAMRIPFIAKLPGVQGGRRINSNVSLLDLAPTLLELAGVKNEAIVSPLYGNSLIDAINGDTSNWPDRVLAEYSAEAAQAPMVLIRQGRYKYIQAAGDPPQLFDLSNDHDELINLATEAQHQNLLNEFSKAVEQHWNLETLDEEIRQSQIQRKLIGESLAKGHYQSWDYQPKVDYSKIYVRDPEGAELTDRKVRVAAKGYKLPGT
jgi:choline-sulfatase